MANRNPPRKTIDGKLFIKLREGVYGHSEDPKVMDNLRRGK